MKKVFCIVLLTLLTSCGGWKLNELNNNLEKLEEFNEKYADVDKFERDSDDEERDSDLLDDFRFACEWGQENEYALLDNAGNMEFPKNLVIDTKQLTQECIEAWNKYVAYLESDYIDKNVSDDAGRQCIQDRIDQTNTNLTQFKSQESELASRYTTLALKFIAAWEIVQILSTNIEDYKAMNDLWLEYGTHKIKLITDSTLHLITKDVCVETGIEKEILESLDNQFSNINE